MEDWQNQFTENTETINEARNYGKPTLTVLGVFRGGKVVRVEWTGAQVSLSDRTLTACITLGIDVIDETVNYVFTGEVI